MLSFEIMVILDWTSPLSAIPNLHFVQCGSWISTVSVKTGHCALCSGEWVTSGLRAFCPGGLAKPRPVVRASYWFDVQIGGKLFATTSCLFLTDFYFPRIGKSTQESSRSKQKGVKYEMTLARNYGCLAVHFCIRRFCIWRSHYNFSS